MSYYPQEEELLLPPNTSLRVKGVYDATDFNLRRGLSGSDSLIEPDFVPLEPLSDAEAVVRNVLLVLLEELDG